VCPYLFRGVNTASRNISFRFLQQDFQFRCRDAVDDSPLPLYLAQRVFNQLFGRRKLAALQLLLNPASNSGLNVIAMQRV
jgi:hypothetical protein